MFLYHPESGRVGHPTRGPRLGNNPMRGVGWRRTTRVNSRSARSRLDDQPNVNSVCFSYFLSAPPRSSLGHKLKVRDSPPDPPPPFLPPLRPRPSPLCTVHFQKAHQPWGMHGPYPCSCVPGATVLLVGRWGLRVRFDRRCEPVSARMREAAGGSDHAHGPMLPARCSAMS